MMIVVLGALALLQMAFIPGFLLLRFVRLPSDSITESLLLCLGLSLPINYVLVMFMTLCGIFLRNSVFALMAVEIALLIALLIWGRDAVDTSEPPEVARRFNASSLLAALTIIAAAFVLCRSTWSNGLLFRTWDAVFSWNRWAADWSQNRLPETPWSYPQLLPANWALSYVIIGNRDIQLFARSLMTFFPLGILASFVVLARRTRDATWLVAMLVCALLLWYYLRPYLADGYADLAVAFFAFVAYVMLQRNKKKDVKSVFLFSTLTAAAAATKQAGFFAAAIGLICVMVMVFRSDFAPAHRVRLITTALLVPVVLVGSWYLIDLAGAVPGGKRTIMPLLIATHQGRDLLHRVLFGMHLMGWPLEAILLLSLAAVWQRRARPIVLAIVLPFTLIWALGYSYDLRNLTLILPFTAFTGTAGAVGYLRRFQPPGERSWVLLDVLVVLSIAAIIVTTFLLARPDVARRSAEEIRRQGSPELDRWLYQELARRDFHGLILSDYRYVLLLPEFLERTLYAPYNEYSQSRYRLRNDFAVKVVRPSELAAALSDQPQWIVVDWRERSPVSLALFDHDLQTRGYAVTFASGDRYRVYRKK